MRDAFLLDPDVIFLNHGSFGACPREVFAQYQQWQLEMERNPVEFLGRRSGELLGQARQKLATYLGARADDLAFVSNATTGVNIVARSLSLSPGDEVVGTDHEYGACEAVWNFVCNKAGAHYRRVQIPLPFDPSQFLPRMLDAITPRTKVIYVSHITSTTALIFPLAELCRVARERGIITLIDGAHAPANIDLQLDQLGADFYTGNCHKWMCAPKGSAFLHVREEHQNRLDAQVISWGYVANSGGHTGFDAYTGSTTLERRLQWQGTRDLAAYLTVPAAIDFQTRHDWRRRRLQCRALALDTMQRVLQYNGLQPIAPTSAPTQMLTIPVRTSDADGLRKTLFEKHRIEVPVTRHGNHVFVRLAVQVYNMQDDLDALVNALARETDGA
jgi:isopenicillin-N epimerase